MGSTRPDFWVLFLDGDEVPDGVRFAAWWTAQSSALNRNKMFKFSNYWSFIHPRLVSTEFEDSILLAHSTTLDHDALQHPRERDGIYMWHWTSPSPTALGQRVLALERGVADSSGEAMFWHFSWVRGLAPQGDWAVCDDNTWSWLEDARLGICEKVKNWGHRGDRDWIGLILSEFSKLEETRAWPKHDFVHGHEMRLLPNIPSPLVLLNRVT
jgi:hypothetical protein